MNLCKRQTKSHKLVTILSLNNRQQKTMATKIILSDRERLKQADIQADVGDTTIPGKLASRVAAAAPKQGATDIIRPSWPEMTNPGNRPVGGARSKALPLRFEPIAEEGTFAQSLEGGLGTLQTPALSDPWEHASSLLTASPHSPFFQPPTQRAESPANA